MMEDLIFKKVGNIFCSRQGGKSAEPWECIIVFHENGSLRRIRRNYDSISLQKTSNNIESFPEYIEVEFLRDKPSDCIESGILSETSRFLTCHPHEKKDLETFLEEFSE